MTTNREQYNRIMSLLLSIKAYIKFVQDHPEYIDLEKVEELQKALLKLKAKLEE